MTGVMIGFNFFVCCDANVMSDNYTSVTIDIQNEGGAIFLYVVDKGMPPMGGKLPHGLHHEVAELHARVRDC